MRKLFFAGTLLLAGCATNSVTQTPISEIDIQRFKPLLNKDARNTNIFKTNYVVDKYTKAYVNRKHHKAFALSESGAWAYKSDFIDLSLAIEGALGSCELSNKENQAQQPCQIINIDGHWAADFFE